MSDQDLVERAKAGDQTAFERLVVDNQNKVYSLCVRLTGDREDSHSSRLSGTETTPTFGSMVQNA